MAILKVYNGSSWVTALGKTYNGSSWVGDMWFYDGTAWIRLFPAPLAVSVSPSSLNEADNNCPLTSSTITASPSGGSGGYSYAWSWQSGGTGITILSPTSSSTTCRVSGSGLKSGTLRCIVTDSDTDTAQDTCAVTLECGSV